MANVRDTIIEYKQKNPDATYEEICAVVKKRIPGCKTTPASVACTLSRLRSAIAKGEGLPSGVTGAMTYEALPEPDPEETIEEATERIKLRYGAMERMVPKIIAGKMPSLIVSGPPGMQKSWTVDSELKKSEREIFDFAKYAKSSKPEPERDEEDEDYEPLEDVGPVVESGPIDASKLFDKIGGNCSAVGLYQALWNMRNGGLIYLDDCDAVFRDEDALNLLKIATDSTKERLISWRKNAGWLEDLGIPQSFEFKGSIVFLTNIDFEAYINKGHKDSEHYKALIDRAAYLCLTLRTRRDFMIRIRMKCEGKDGILMKSYGLSLKESETVLRFVEEHQTKFYNLSIRLACQIAVAMKNDPKGWEDDVRATKMRTYGNFK